SRDWSSDVCSSDLDVQGLVGTAIDNGGNTASAAQAAARTRTLDATQSGVEFHGKTPIHKGLLPVKKRGELRRELSLPRRDQRDSTYIYSTKRALTDSAFDIRSLARPNSATQDNCPIF